MMDVEEGQHDGDAMNPGPSTVTPAASMPTPKLSTLDEPVSETLMRDVRMVGKKLKHVLRPAIGQKGGRGVLVDWDLWGPLFVCLSLSIILSSRAPSNQTSLVFASVFAMVWVGAAVVTVNASLLGGNISFFQSVCVLGYCIFPLLIASFACLFWGNPLYRGLVTATGFVWSTGASVGFMASMVPPSRKALAVYPVLLFYLFIAWMVAVE